MAKKSKRNVVKTDTGKKVPRVSVMEKQKKDRQRLYTFLSLGAIVLLAAGIAIGAILGGGNKTEEPLSELVNGHFAQKDGYFEMDAPKGWIVETTLEDIAPYGADNTLQTYVFRPGDYEPFNGTNVGGAKVASPSPNNIICAIAHDTVSKDDIEKYLTAQNVIDHKDIVAYLNDNAKQVGEKIKDAYGWILGQKKEDGITQGSYIAFVESKDIKIYISSKFDSEENSKAVLDALKSIKSTDPESIQSYIDNNKIVTIGKPEGWKIDITSQTMQMHQIPQGLGAMIYPAGTKTMQEMTPAQLNESVKKQQGKDIGEVVSGLTIPQPLIDYMAVYSIDKTVDPAVLNQSFSGMIGFGENGITNPYTWILDNIKNKGLSLAGCSGKYFIAEKPIKIMQQKPMGNLFSVIENEKGKVLVMAGWTNDGIQKIIIDTLNKITPVSEAAKTE
ncbi:MAG: hypothetical protein KA140_03050 [Caldisericia bacterium]|nr:hypothetical protein [Caldisericia bacterium]